MIENDVAVSVVILNYNAKELLRQCLNSVTALEWPDLDVIVVDNTSTDGSPDMVESEFGARVRLIRRTVNSPTAGRNDGFRAARGQYILSLDNDIILPDKRVISKAISLLTRFPRVGLLAFNICSVEHPTEPLPEHWWYAPSLQRGKNRFFYTDYYTESGAFFRSQLIRDLGGYDENLFREGEGPDLALKVIGQDFDVLFCPTLVAAEMRVRGFVSSRRTSITYLSVRNKLWMVWKHYPVWRGIRYIVPRIALAAGRSVRYRWVGYFLKGLRDGIFAPRAIRIQRKPLSTEMWHKIDKIRRGMCFVDLEPSFISELKR